MTISYYDAARAGAEVRFQSAAALSMNIRDDWDWYIIYKMAEEEKQGLDQERKKFLQSLREYKQFVSK